MPFEAFGYENMPAAFQDVFQQNMLERGFHGQLEYKGVLRQAAFKKPVPIRSGEAIIYSKAGQLVPVVDSLDASGWTNSADFGSSADGAGVGSNNPSYTVEQFRVSIGARRQYFDINIIQDQETLASMYAQNWVNLGRQVALSMDLMAQKQLSLAYEAGRTYVLANTSSSTTCRVDNIYGLDKAFALVTIGGTSFASGEAQAVSGSNPLAATVYPAGSTSGAYAVSIVGATADTGTALANTDMKDAAMGYLGNSGTLTFSAAQSINLGDVIVASDAQAIIRPGGAASRYQMNAGSTLGMQLLINAKAELERNGVLPFADESYLCVLDPIVEAQMFTDPQFEIMTQGAAASSIFKNATFSSLFGLTFAKTTNTPSYTLSRASTAGAVGLKARHAYVIGQQAVQESSFDGFAKAYRAMGDNGISAISIVDDYALISRPALNRTADIYSQTWYWIGGHCCQTDATVTSAVMPSASNARVKRAVCVEVLSAS